MNRKILMLFLMIMLLTVAAAFGQVPKTLSYQGVLTGANGNPVPNGNYQLTFRIYTEASGGSPLWVETQSANVQNGVFSVILGKASALNLAFDKTYWLGITVAQGSELAPRTELTAAAYSRNAAAITDSIVTGGKIADGHVVRSLNGLTDKVKLSAGANVSIAQQGDSLVIAATGGGSNSPWLTQGNAIYYNNGNVGIGTANPTAQLEITGSFRLPETTANGSAGVIGFGNNPAIHTYGTDNFFAGENAGNFTMTGVGANTGVGRNALLRNTDGSSNTAIGMSALLNNTTGVANTATGQSALLLNTTGSGNTGFGRGALQSNSTGNNNTALGYNANVSSGNFINATAIGANAVVNASNKIRLGDNNVTLVETAGTVSATAFIGDGSGLTNLPLSPWQISGNEIYYNNGNVGIGTNDPNARVHSQSTGNIPSFLAGGSSADFAVPGTNQAMQFGSWDGASVFNEWMRINPSGYLGIGTTSPSAVVHSRSSGSVPSFLAGGSSADFAVPDNNQAMQFGKWDSSSVFTEWMRLNPSGYLGVGTNSPNAVVHSRSSGNVPSFLAGGSSADYAVLNTRPMQFGHWDGSSVFTERMRIGPTGNVGIGTTTPNAALDVVGGVDITRTTNATALDIQHSGALTNPLVNIETASNGPAIANLLQIKTGSIFLPSTVRFIECVRDTDVKFRVDGDGDVTADGQFTGGGADFAEMMAVSSGVSSVEAGDVLVIDPGGARSVLKSSQSRSTLVAGIYSTKPGFVGSERDWDKPSGESMVNYSMADMAGAFNEIPMAVVGIVPCKVSAENGAIKPGDLLVTSTTRGHAMRDDDPKNGTVVGKALGYLNSGTGVIKVLVTLQ